MLVSTSNYDDPNLRKLATPSTDAAALARVLGRPDIGGFSARHRSNLRASQMLTEVAEFFADRQPDDFLLLYFSGHGLKNDAGRLFIAARDTTRRLLRAKALADDFLLDVMRESKAKRQVLILDCCFGGAFSKAFMAKGDEQVGVRELFQGGGRVVLTASTAMEFAYESDAEPTGPRLSVYTKTLVQGLETGEADTDRDGRISVQDIHDYAFKRIVVPGSTQTPTISSIGQEGALLLATTPVTAARGASASPFAGRGPRQALDLSPWVKVRDQGSEGSNPAIAAVTAMEASLAVQGQLRSLSARYVYQKAKQLSGAAQGDDTGVAMDTLTRVISEFGAPPEDDWPYVVGETDLPPGRTWEWLDGRAGANRAQLYPITGYDEVAFHLGKGRPVLAGFVVYRSSWFTADPAHPGRIPPPKRGDVVMGSLATTIVACDEADGSLRFAHTWGDAWGDRGFGSMGVNAAQAMFFDQDQMWAVEVRVAKGFRWGGGPQPATSVAARTIEPAPPTSGPHPTRGARVVYDARGGEALGVTDAAIVRREGEPPSTDDAVNEVFDGLGMFASLVKEVYGRDSWDGAGGPLEAVVHYGRDFANAFWAEGERRMFVGDGDGTHFRRFTAAEIVAGQAAFGMVNVVTGLPYRGQSGSLAESMACVFGVLAKQRHLGQTAGAADWLVGAGVVVDGAALMSMKRPGTAFDNATMGRDTQVGHMREFVRTEADNGGVHVNCGIPNRAFYLVAVELGGHAWERAGRIWYESLDRTALGARPTFNRFARTTLKTAVRLFGKGSAGAGAVLDAWIEVGVLTAGATGKPGLLVGKPGL